MLTHSLCIWLDKTCLRSVILFYFFDSPSHFNSGASVATFFFFFLSFYFYRKLLLQPDYFAVSSLDTLYSPVLQGLQLLREAFLSSKLG